jgi:S-adenosylmethionine/arginine decarboxylase-like enzyme
MPAAARRSRQSSFRPRHHVPPAIVHLTADFIGAAPPLLSDQSLISGLLVSAAGAAGMTASGAPIVLKHPDGALSVILPIDGCHMSLHTMPGLELAMLDVLARPHHDTQRALDVVARRIAARSVRAERRERG